MRFPLLTIALTILVLSTSPVSAAIYKWVDDKGNIHFTDTPPSDSVDSQVVNPDPNVIEGYGKTSERSPSDRTKTLLEESEKATLPPVEMFVTSWCGYCKKAEAWFNARSIPYVKYDIEKDQQAARRKASLTQSRGVPFILIGDVGIPGYSEAAFEKALKQYN